jgi:hypothetical protein
MRPCLSSGVIGAPRSTEAQSSSGPSGFFGVERLTLPRIGPVGNQFPCRKKATCVVGWPVIPLQAAQWQMWLPIGLRSEWL